MTGWWRSAFISPRHPRPCSTISPTPAATSSGWAAARRWSRYQAAPTASGCAAASKRPVSSSRSARRTGWCSPGAGRTTPPCRRAPRASSSRCSPRTAGPASYCGTTTCPTTSRASITGTGGSSTSAGWRSGPGAGIPARTRTRDHERVSSPLPAVAARGGNGYPGRICQEGAHDGRGKHASRCRPSPPLPATSRPMVMPDLYLTYLSRPDVEAAALADEEIVAAIESGLAMQGRGDTVIEPRVHLEPKSGAEGHFNVLRGFIGGQIGMAGVKVVGDFVGNYTRGLPSELGLLCLFDPETGAPVAVIDASGITEMRTGAVTAVGAKYLAPERPRTLGHIGARGSAYWNVRLLDRLFGFEEIRVHSRRPASRERFAEH